MLLVSFFGLKIPIKEYVANVEIPTFVMCKRKTLDFIFNPLT